MSSLIARFGLALAAATALAVAGGWAAGLGLVESPSRPVAMAGWVADTLAHFQLFYALGFALAFALLAWKRRWRPLAAALPFAAAVVVQLWPYFGPGLPAAHAAPQSPGTARELHVAAANLWFRNTHIDRIRAWIAAEDADVLVLSEVTVEMRAALAPVLAGYPWQAMSSRARNADVLVASRVPTTFVPLADADARDYLVQARLCPEGASAPCAWLIGAHVPSPVSPARLRHRDVLLAEIGAIARGHAGERVIVAGDLNTSPWAPGFRTMAERGALIDAARGRGIWPTWNTRLVVAQTPIDHILATAGVTVLDRAVGPDIGSDHLPVAARLRL